MAAFKVHEITKTVGGRLLGGGEAAVTGVTIDSRAVPRGSLFFAVKGDRFDGHDYVGDAFAKGARAAVVSREVKGLPSRKAVIVVDDTVRALQALAAHHRARFKKLLVIGVTGSNGKTTVKDMIARALARKYRTLQTRGNLNNHIGVPLTLFGLNDTYQAAVIEMGMNAPGEIATLARIARPSIAVITNVGPAHLEGLKTIAAVRRAKAELLDCLGPKGTAALNADDPHSRPLIEQGGKNIITFGRAEWADVNLVDTWSNGKLGYWAAIQSGGKEQVAHVPLFGKHNVDNALAAFAAGIAAGVPPADIAAGVAAVKPANMRMTRIIAPNGALIVNDAYNANPASVEAALCAMAGVKGEGRLIFVFGDMFELGKTSVAAHRSVARRARAAGVDRLYTLGEKAAVTARAAGALGIRSSVCASVADAARRVARTLKPSDTLLVKGSRGMALERVAARVIEIMEGR